MWYEFNAPIRNNIWDLVPQPYDVNIIQCMWVFRHKKIFDGCFECYKARLVGDDRSQTTGVDCHETSRPVVKPETIHIFLTIVISKS